MSKTKYAGVAALIAGLGIAASPAALAMSIDELTAVQREAQAAEARKKLEVTKPVVAPTPSAPVPASLSAMPTGGGELMDEPSMATAQLVAIYGVADDLTAEFKYGSGTLKATRHAKLPEDWRVESIDSNRVVLYKPLKKGQKGKVPRRVYNYSAQAPGDASGLPAPAPVGSAAMPAQGPGVPIPAMPNLTSPRR